MAGITFKMSVITSSLAKINFVVPENTFKVAAITFSVAKITFVLAEIVCKIAAITSSVANTSTVTEIPFNVAVITSSEVKITFVVAEITFQVSVMTYSVVNITLKNGSRECFVVHFVFNRKEILYIHVKALDSEFQLISKILIHFKIWVLIGQKCETLSIVPNREISVKIL